MEGGDLKGLIGEGPTYLTEDQAKKIAKKALEATAIMHSRGIIHRDLKPSVSTYLSPLASQATPRVLYMSLTGNKQ